MSFCSRKRRRLARKGLVDDSAFRGLPMAPLYPAHVAPCVTEGAALVQSMLDAPAPPVWPFTVTSSDGEPQP